MCLVVLVQTSSITKDNHAVLSKLRNSYLWKPQVTVSYWLQSAWSCIKSFEIWVRDYFSLSPKAHNGLCLIGRASKVKWCPGASRIAPGSPVLGLFRSRAREAPNFSHRQTEGENPVPKNKENRFKHFQSKWVNFTGNIYETSRFYVSPEIRRLPHYLKYKIKKKSNKSNLASCSLCDFLSIEMAGRHF